MRLRVFLASWLVLIMPINLIWADIDIDEQNMGSESITEPAKRSPFSFNAHIDGIGKAKINKGFFKGDDVQFAESQAEVGMVLYYCPAYTEGARLAASYTATYIGWSENPWFDQDHFNTISLTIAGFSKRLDRWFWRSQLSINFDAAIWNSQFINYDLLLWGRYEYSRTIGIHVGFLAQTGMLLDRVYPIIGADWQISKKWKLNLVYPVNVSLEYALNPSWSLAIAGRSFNSRHRVHYHETFSKALVRYENVGAEFAMKYEEPNISANIHAGTTLGSGRYRIANRFNQHAHNYKLDPSGYVGGEIDFSF